MSRVSQAMGSRRLGPGREFIISAGNESKYKRKVKTAYSVEHNKSSLKLLENKPQGRKWKKRKRQRPDQQKPTTSC